MYHQHRSRPGRPQLFHRSHDRGEWCVAAATFAFAIAWLILDDWEFPEAIVGRIVIQFALLLVAGSAVVAMVSWHRPFSWVGSILFWLVLFGFGVAGAVPSLSLTAAVEPAEALVITMAITASVSGNRLKYLHTAAVAAAAAMLILFGAIHLIHAAAVTGLVPSWMPLRHVTPYVTGSLLLAAGVSFASGRARPIAATAVALMFLSWLPVVHFERLSDDPGSLAEWRFALTALALAGALLIVGRSRISSTKIC